VVGVGLVLFVTCSPVLAAGAAAEHLQPVASSDSRSAAATGKDGQPTAELHCYAGSCITTTAHQAGRLRTASPRKAARRGLSAPHLVSMGDRKVGLRLLRGIYATVSLVPSRPLLDPIPPDVSATDRVRVGLGCMLRF
jgi:hypothetical protein